MNVPALTLEAAIHQFYASRVGLRGWDQDSVKVGAHDTELVIAGIVSMRQRLKVTSSIRPLYQSPPLDLAPTVRTAPLLIAPTVADFG